MTDIHDRIAKVLIDHDVDEQPVSIAEITRAIIAELGLEEETHRGPISMPTYNDDGSPAMDERWVQPMQKHHFEWVTRRRWVTTPWEEVGERETSEELSARLERARHEQ